MTQGARLGRSDLLSDVRQIRQIPRSNLGADRPQKSSSDACRYTVDPVRLSRSTHSEYFLAHTFISGRIEDGIVPVSNVLTSCCPALTVLSFNAARAIKPFI